MDTQRDSDLLEQHNTSQSAVAMLDAEELRPSQETTTDSPETSGLTDVVPGAPAMQLESEQPAPGGTTCGPAVAPGAPVQQTRIAPSMQEPGVPVARTGFQASLRPYSSGQGVPLTMHPEARPCLQIPAVGRELEMLGPEAGELLRQRRVAEESLPSEDPGDRMIAPLGNTTSTPRLTTVGLSGGILYHKKNGSDEYTSNSTWRQTYGTKARVLDRSAMPADDEAVGKYRSPSVSVVKTGHVKGTCLSRPAWRGSTLCALHTQSWKSAHIRT
eukprot:5557547-Amphidinium_carterae.1